MKKFSINKNSVFSILLAIVIGAIINKIIPPHVTPVFTMVVSKNRISIVDIHQVRDIEMHKTVMIDRINLADKSRFRHPKLGDLGYNGDFFADIEAPFSVKVAGDYTFYVSSDDGFILSVDNQKLCEWTHDRPLSTSTCHVKLSAGSHNFTLNYFQGYGNAGLIMSYANTSSGKQYLAGDDSKFIEFQH